MTATCQMRKRHEERPGDERWYKKTKHMNPTDNEDDKQREESRKRSKG